MVYVAIVAGTYHPQRCGVAGYTSHLRASLRERDVKTIVFTTREAAEVVDEPLVLGAIDRWGIGELWPLAQAIRGSKVDILHIQHAAGTYSFDRSIFLLPLLLRLMGWKQPIVTTLHEYGWWEWEPKGIPPRLLEWLKVWGQRHGWWDREDGFLLTKSDAVVVTNPQAERVVHARLPYLKYQTHQIPIGANVEVWPTESTEAKQQLKQKYGWDEDAIVFVFFGFLHPVKGLETLLEAFQQVVKLRPEARLLLVGGVESLALPGTQAANYWQNLEDTINQLSLNSMVAMTGYLAAEAVSQHLAGADIGVLPFNHGVTLKSGSLLTLLSHSLPVVATRPDPVDPDLEDQNFVRWAHARDVKGLADELLLLLEDATLRKCLGEAGYRFSRQFSWPGIAKAHLEIYQSLLSGCSEVSNGEGSTGG